MKTRKLFLNAILAIGSIIAVSCSETIDADDDALALDITEKSASIALAQVDSCTFSGELTDAEIAGLIEMREEEKLAQDVYLYFYEMYGYNIFNNISQSESRHTSAVLNLIEGYGLEDPASSETGVFNAETFQALYDSLINAGSESLVAALKTGAFIEEFDINDLQELLENSQNEDVIRVYSNLLDGSESHIRSFSNMLSQMGEVYEPQIITADEYEAILSSSSTKGNNNGTNGNGNNNASQGNNNGNKNPNASASGVCDGSGSNK